MSYKITLVAALFALSVSSCKGPEQGIGMGGADLELSLSFFYEDETDTTIKEVGGVPPTSPDIDDTTSIEIFSQISKFISKNISLGFTTTINTRDTKATDGDDNALDSLDLLFSPRYYWSVSADESMAVYVGPDLGLVYQDVDNAGTDDDFDLTALAYGATAGLKFYVGDSFSLFTELYTLYYDRSDSDGFEADIDQLGLRLGFSVFL
ncbi:MAG: hypothetical protein ACI835_005796 [Planctomycetota bacterium]|jgi:hypothetical protein